MAERLTITQNLRWLAAGNIAVKPLWFLFLMMSARFLGPAEFGRFMFALSFVAVLGYLFEGGLDNYLMREVARDRARFRELFATTATLKILSGILVGVVGVSMAAIVGLDARYMLLIAVAAGHPLTNGLMQHTRFAFRGLEVMQFEAWSIVVEKIAVLLFCGAALLMVREATVFMAGFVLAYAFACTVTILALRHRMGLPTQRMTPRQAWLGVLRPAFPFAIMGMFMVVYNRAGTLMLQWLTGSDVAVGFFGAGSRIVEGFALLPAIVVMPLYATFARSREDAGAVRRLVPRAMRGLLVIATTLAVLILLFAGDVTRLLYGEAFVPAAGTIGVTVLTMIPLGLTWLFINLAGAVGRQAELNRWIIGVTAMNLMLNYVLISSLGVDGAAWTAVITETGMALSAIWVGRDFIEGGEIARIIAGVAVPVLALVSLDRAGLLPGPVTVQMGVSFIILAGGFLVFRVIRIDDLRALVSGVRT